MSCCARIGSMFLVEKNLETRLPCREQRQARAAETEIWRDCQRSSTELEEKLEGDLGAVHGILMRTRF